MRVQVMVFAAVIHIAVAMMLVFGNSVSQTKVTRLPNSVDSPPLDSEARLSRGLPLTFSSAHIYDLELIPGISDTLAAELLRARTEIERHLPLKGCQSLTHAHGIGERSAEKLCPDLLGIK